VAAPAAASPPQGGGLKGLKGLFRKAAAAAKAEGTADDAAAASSELAKALGSSFKESKQTLTSAALCEICDEYAAEIAREQAKLKERANQTLKVRLGVALTKLLSKGGAESKGGSKGESKGESKGGAESKAATKSQFREIVTSWANPKTGEVSKMDFRKHVRKLVDEPDIKKVDALFALLDGDGGGSLDADELSGALRTIHDEAKAQLADDAVLHTRVAFLRSREAAALEVKRQTVEAEEADAELKKIESNSSLESRVGKAILGKGLRLVDLIRTWEATNGEVNPKQFRNNVKALVPDASADESTALFESLDADGGGTLDTEEIKEALALLREASVEADKEATRLKKASVSLWKAAKAAQAENKKVRRADQLEAIKQAEAAAAGAARAEADAEAARMAKEAKAAAAKRAKEDEKAEFEAKLQARRQANAAGTDP